MCSAMKIFSEMIKDVIEKILMASQEDKLNWREIMSEILIFKRP